ncbi:TetR/AcrR family transcriptional regulator [Eubacteriales bacterium SGI.150]
MYFYYENRPYHDDNTRVKNTKLRIYKSTIKLLKTNAFDQITISDICMKAQVSRAAFYNHFGSKLNVIKEIMELIVNTYSEQLVSINQKKKVSLLDVYQQLCHVFWLNRDFFLILDRNNIDILYDYCFHLQRNLYYYFGNTALNDSPFEQFILFYYGGAVSSILLQWFQGTHPFSIEEMAMLLLQLSPCRHPLPSKLV